MAFFSSANDRISCPSVLVNAAAEVVEFVPYQLRPTSTGMVDDYAVTIETQNISGAPTWGISNAQHEAIARFIAWLSQRTELGGVPVNISLDRVHVIGHREVASNGTICPGPGMDLDRIVTRARELVDLGNGAAWEWRTDLSGSVS